MEAEQRLVLADEQEHERRRRQADPAEGEQRMQEPHPRPGHEQPESDQRGSRKVEREERPDDRHDAEVFSKVLLEVDRADDEHRYRAERPQDRGRAAGPLFGQHRLVGQPPRRGRAPFA